MFRNREQLAAAILVPGIFVLFGLAYLRRKKSGVHCDTGGNNNDKSRIKAPANETTTPRLETIKEEDSHKVLLAITATEDTTQTDLRRSKSVPCTYTSSSPVRDSIDRQTGKSTPIDIAPNPRSPPAKVTEQQIDAELLKLKLQESDYKNLKAIRELTDDEFSADSPHYLQGSVERRPFSFTKPAQNATEEPVVVKANMTSKIYTSGSERDSANASPTENGLNCRNEEEKDEIVEESRKIGSPPLSECSENSGDSGNCSIKSEHVPTTVAASTIVYDFVVPVSVVQHLIGVKGRYVHQLKVRTGVKMIVNMHPTSQKQRICSLEGTQAEVDKALAVLRQKLPVKRYPQVTFDRVFVTQPIPFPAFDIASLQLQLIEGINNDVAVCAVVSGNHVFVHQPLHPTYPQLNVLHAYMAAAYNNNTATKPPTLDKVIVSAICAAPDGFGNWCRVQIMSHDEATDDVVAKYLDIGGYGCLKTKDLRQIHADFMILPFQAIEVMLSNVKPVKDEPWSLEAGQVVHSLTNGMILQAQVAGYTQEACPEVYLYACYGKDNVVFINKELVARNLAEWIPEDSITNA